MTRSIARAAAFVLAFAMVFAVARAGTPYFFCAPMGTVAPHACCAALKAQHARSAAIASGASMASGAFGAAEAGECPTPSPFFVDGATCCKAITPSDLRMVHASPAPDVAAAPWLGVLPEVHPFSRDDTNTRTHAAMARARARLERARPPRRPPTPSFLRVYLI
ncbi:hypothetical protein [Pendulispora albinea]|uniref:Bifunctional inhibitor/plant lipid transfer protein/seed storage helical domain-containing protein n=1 Tax=Pendulispora albinea TaxID=2741071 RepID=A0ABZ2MC81_9BACT